VLRKRTFPRSDFNDKGFSLGAGSPCNPLQDRSGPEEVLTQFLARQAG
jgi:hypothetical protein